MKKKGLVLILTILFIIIYKGHLFRAAVLYRPVGHRASISLTDESLKRELSRKVATKRLSFEEITEISRTTTHKFLQFSTDRISNNPNDAVASGKANCVGYAALFVAVAEYLDQLNGTAERHEWTHKIAKISLFGVDVHPWFSSPFFKDHDYVFARDLSTGTSMALDPVLSDYWSSVFEVRSLEDGGQYARREERRAMELMAFPRIKNPTFKIQHQKSPTSKIKIFSKVSTWKVRC